ncbi:MAG: HAMP domain-containing protein, partial [Acidimicrobiia bacterium]
TPEGRNAAPKPIWGCARQSQGAGGVLVIVFGMGTKEAVRTRAMAATRQWSITSKMTLAMVPLAVVALVLGLLLVWNLVSSDTADGFSGIDGLAVAVAIVVTLVALGSLLVAYRMGRSMARRIAQVSKATNRMARKDIIDLLDALRTPDPDLAAIAPLDLDTENGDEIGDLARSFEGMHRSLIEVAARQMESLRVGVSSILVTLARRNSGLVDRQLALLDELESREDDPKTLGGYYQVDHLAARMRRNAESLLVLAGSESPRVWAKATEMSNVVRAAVSEVDEYQRVEVVALEPARLSGAAVTDVAHLLAELLDNAVQFSPPTEPVRVTGLFGVDGYELLVSDRGVGLSDPRVAELNRILEKPPTLGLSVEPTMGIHVVANLAHRHGLTVQLVQSAPGLTVKVNVPRDRLEAAKPAESPTFEESDEIIDLTHPSMIEPTMEPVAARTTSDASGELPVRVPGKAFHDEEAAQSVAAGEGATSIKTALSDFERGQREAQGEPEGDET